MAQKICSRSTCEKAGIPQDYSEYYADKRASDGLASRCKECIRKKVRKYQADNPEKCREQHSRWRYERGGKERMNEYQREWRKKNMTPARKMRKNVSNAVYEALRLQNRTKGGVTFEHLPYTPAQLKEHLEKQFDEHMSWENYGTYWQIDHLIPQAALVYDSFEHPNFQKCWALDNLQPMEATANRSKGSLYEGERHYHAK